MCEYFCAEFIDFVFNNKKLIVSNGLFSLRNLKKYMKSQRNTLINVLNVIYFKEKKRKLIKRYIAYFSFADPNASFEIRD